MSFENFEKWMELAADLSEKSIKDETLDERRKRFESGNY